MKTKLSLLPALLIIVGLVFTGTAFAGGAQESGDAVKPIRLGGVWPLGDITGDQGSKAAQLAVDVLNENGGLLGRPVVLDVIDSELNPEKGAAAIERLATVNKVDFFIGGMASGVHLGQIPAMKR